MCETDEPSAAQPGSAPAVHSAAISVFRYLITHWVHTLTVSVNTLLNVLLSGFVSVCVCMQKTPLHEELHPSELVCVVHAASRGRADQRRSALLGR